MAAYALIEFVEAIGLWLTRRWGEYFAVIATGVFLPLEIYELTEKVTVLRAGALLINLAAVIWLLWSKRRFGINGGGAAYRAKHHTESLPASSGRAWPSLQLLARASPIRRRRLTAELAETPGERAQVFEAHGRRGGLH